MTSKSPPTTNCFSWVLPVITIAIAIAIFVADTLARLIAVSALYASVVLLAVKFFDARGVLLVVAGCIGLAIISYLLSRHGELSIIALANLLVGILVIGPHQLPRFANQTAQITLRKSGDSLTSPTTQCSSAI